MKQSLISQVKVIFYYDIYHFMLAGDLGKNDVEWTGKAKIRRVDIPGCKQSMQNSILTTPGFTGRTFDSFQFCQEGTLISVSMIPHNGRT